MAKRPPSIKQVANAAGVSTATVSNVFSGKKAVSPALADHVRETARRLGFQINRVASNLRSGESRIVTVLVPDLADPFFTTLVTELERRAESDGYDIIVANANDDLLVEERRLTALMSWQPAGMVVVPCRDVLPPALEASRSDLPICIVDRGANAEGVDTVRIDNAAAGAMAATHLVDLGHRQVLVVASDLNLQAIRQRCAGAREPIEAAGGQVTVLEVGSRPEQGAHTLAAWLKDNEMPRAILTTTDMTTLAVLSCLASRRCDIGSEVSLVGFDDYPWMVARRTPITAIRQPVEEIAKQAWKVLTGRIRKIDRATRSIVLQCQLEVRASTRRSTGTPRVPVSPHRHEANIREA